MRASGSRFSLVVISRFGCKEPLDDIGIGLLLRFIITLRIISFIRRRRLPRRRSRRWRWRRRRSRYLSGRAQWNDLLLNARLVTELHRSVFFFSPRLVGRQDATLNGARQRLHPLLVRRAEKRLSIEFQIFPRHSVEIKELTDRLLDVVETKAETRGDPAPHQQLGRAEGSTSTDAQDLKRNAKRQGDVLIRNLENVGKLSVDRVRSHHLRLETSSQDRSSAGVHPATLLVPPVAQRIDLILIENHVRHEDERRPRLIEIKLNLLLANGASRRHVHGHGKDRRLTDQSVTLGMKTNMKNVARRHHEILVVESPLDHLITSEIVEDVACLSHHRIALPGIHEVKRIYFKAIVAKRQGVGVA